MNDTIDPPKIVLSALRRENQETVGLRCPKCGCKHLVVETVRQQFDETKRYRVCRNCGMRIRTFERIG
jgi:DNA-directed RNA polymerase subunit RPC12/RpoP